MFGNNAHSFSLVDLLEEATQKLKHIHKNARIDAPTLSIVWGHTCIFIEEQMVKGKAVTMPGLGTFTYIHKKQDLGNKGVRVTRSPVFVVADAFCQSNDVRKDNFSSNLTTSVPAVSLNNSLIASQSGTNRDIVMDFHKEVIRSIATALRNNRGLSVELKNIGTLGYSGGNLKVVFNSDFAAQIQATGSSSNNSTLVDGQLTELQDPATFTSKSAPGKLKVNNFISSGSRTSTPRDEMSNKRSSSIGGKVSGPVILPHMEMPERPKNPVLKLRANSETNMRPLSASLRTHRLTDDDETNLQPSPPHPNPPNNAPLRSHASPARWRSEEEEEGGEEGREGVGFGEEEDESCEHCALAQINARAARLKHAHDRTMDEATVCAQRVALQAIEDKEQLEQRIRRAKREEADVHNRTLLNQKQDTVIKQKTMDFYGDVFYARRPGTPDYIKKSTYKSALEEQIVEKQYKQQQKQIEFKKEYEVFHETQKEADERARKLKFEEKQRLKDHSEFLVQQMTQKHKPGAKDETFGAPRLDRTNPGSTFSPFSSTPSPPSSTTYAEDAYRPATAERAMRRRSFDTDAVIHHKGTIQQRRQREEEERLRQAKEQQEIARINQELRQQQQQEEVNKKLQTRELLRSAWNGQLEQKRLMTLTELSQHAAPLRTSLDLGQLAAEKHKSHCKKCGRGMAGEAGSFRRSSGDFRLASSELSRKTLFLG